MDIILLRLINKFISAIDTVFPNIKNLNYLEILVLATVALSALISISPSVNNLLREKNIRNSFDSFMYSFIGGLLGGFIGILIGLLLSAIIYLIIPPQCYFICDFFYPIRLIVFIFMCWFIGVLSGGIKTIKPLIRFLSNKR